jgi:hypothetical protein
MADTTADTLLLNRLFMSVTILQLDVAMPRYWKIVKAALFIFLILADGLQKRVDPLFF